MTETLTPTAMNAMQQHSPARRVVMWWDNPIADPAHGKPLAKEAPIPPQAVCVGMDDGSVWESTGDAWRRRRDRSVPAEKPSPEKDDRMILGPGTVEPGHPIRQIHVGHRIQNSIQPAVNVGDVNSPARGSGARYNANKVPMQFIPPRVIRLKAQTGLTNSTAQTESLLSVVKMMEVLEAFLEGDDAAIEEFVGVLPVEDIEGSAWVFDFGAVKYKSWNWAKGMNWMIPVACIARHCLAMVKGDLTDKESGRSHWEHAVCNLIMLEHFVRHYPEGDDRPPSVCFKEKAA